MKQALMTLLLVVLLVTCEHARSQTKKLPEGFITVREVQTSTGGGVYVIWADVEMNGKQVSPGNSIVFGCLSSVRTCKKPSAHTQLHLQQMSDDDPQAYKRETEFCISGTGIGLGKPGIGKTEENYRISGPDGWGAVYFLADYQPDTAANSVPSSRETRVAQPRVSQSDLKILTVQKHFLASNMFSPVLTVRNVGSHELGINVEWYATDDGVDVARGSCFARSVRPGTKAEVECDPVVMDHPSASVKLGELRVGIN